MYQRTGQCKKRGKLFSAGYVLAMNGHTNGTGRIEMKRSKGREVKRGPDAGRWCSRKAENSENKKIF